MTFKITEIYTYPIKSLGGIALEEANLTSKGLAYDRYWMLVDTDGNLVSQRDTPQMAAFQTQFITEGVRVIYEGESLDILFESATETAMTTQLWGETIEAFQEATHINQWFSERLDKSVFLVRLANKRLTKNHSDATINFPDSSQFLIIGQAALDNLNAKLDTPIKTNRFRPNIVFEGGTPHIEDNWTALEIGNAAFASIKSCARCKMINLNQETQLASKEPLKTLSTYRFCANKIWFGRYLKYQETESTAIKIGDTLRVLATNS